jgi:hypothetical protein
MRRNDQEYRPVAIKNSINNKNRGNSEDKRISGEAVRRGLHEKFNTRTLKRQNLSSWREKYWSKKQS